MSGIRARKWNKKKTNLFRDFVEKLENMKAEIKEHADQTNKSFKDGMIERELLIQKYAQEIGDQKTFDESLARLAKIQEF